jgi:hypothetical protein
LWHKETPDSMPRAIGELVGSMLEVDPARRASDLHAIAQALRVQSQQMTSPGA